MKCFSHFLSSPKDFTPNLSLLPLSISAVINNTNMFVVLGSLKKKKKSSKGSASEKDSEKENEVFCALVKLTVKSWADLDDDDDDDYYTTAAPPEAAWTASLELTAVMESEAEPMFEGGVAFFMFVSVF
jgi:hypothetical protein